MRPRSSHVPLTVGLAIILAASAIGGAAYASFKFIPVAEPKRYIVGLDEGVGLPAVELLGASVVDRNEPARFVVVEAWDPTGFLAALSAQAGVRFVEEDRDLITTLGVPNDPRFAEQYGLDKIRASAAWDRTLGSTSVTIAVGDSGLDTSHPDISRIAGGRDFTGSNTLYDACNHGTHVTGIAAATTGNGMGVAGVAQARILPFKVIKSNCAGSFSDIANGVVWAADSGARVISLSLGCRGCGSTALTDAIRHATYNRGALVVVAAGNNGCDGCVNFPATLPEVMAVACTTSSDARCWFSSRGGEVDIAAPGENILSTVRGGGYGHRSGTSMAAPHVAGAAALVLAQEPHLSVGALRDRLTSTAKDVDAPGWDRSTGAGRLDAGAALGVSGGGSSSPPPPANHPPPPPPTTVVLHEDFDDGRGDGWRAWGLWRIGGGCLGTRSGAYSLQFNGAAVCHYDTGARSTGQAEFTVDIAGASSAKLTFATKHQVERYTPASYDRLNVLVSANGGAWTNVYARDSRSNVADWSTVTVDLTPHRSGATVVRFEFDSVDHIANGHPGWAVDDVKVERTG